jgi:nonsense-mediated mRNA decay protein 3
MSESRAFCPRCGDSIEGSADSVEEPAASPSAGRGSSADDDRAGTTGASAPADAGTPVADATTDSTPLCADCYFEAFVLADAPARIEVAVCAGCGAVERGERWVDVGARDYTDVAVEAVSEALEVHVDATEFAWGVDPEQVDENTIRMHCGLSAVVRGRPIEEHVTVPVKFSRGTCRRCGRIAGDYYASTVQVRADGRTPTDEEVERAAEIAREYVADREAAGDRNAFVSKIAESADGLDVRVSTTQLGRAIADRIVRQFGGDVSDSETLVTEDEDGDEVYRVTYAVRLPRFRPGDVIEPTADGDEGGDGGDGGPVLVESARGNLKGVRLKTGEPYEADAGDATAPDARRLGRREDGVETTLVAVADDRAVQVLDPETYETKTVARPDYLDPDAETVPVLKSRAGLHVLPAE